MTRPTTRSTTRSTIVDPNLFGTHLTAEQVGAILHHGHWIPVNKGITRRFLEQHHPGWTLAALAAVFTAAGIRSGNQCRKGVAMIHFDRPDHWLVEWIDGTTTCAPELAR